MCVRKRRWLGTVGLGVLLCSPYLTTGKAFAQEAQPKNADRISGMVINSVTHEPIGRALVDSMDNRFATMTDSYGRFEFIIPQADAGQSPASAMGAPISVGANLRPYALSARKPGFLNDANDPYRTMERVPAGSDVVISLVPEALIVGHISLPTSEPPDSIQVELYVLQMREGRAHWASAGMQASRSNGEFRFAGLAAGTYKLLTHELMDNDPQTVAPGGQAYGYAPVYYPGAGDFASAATLQLTPGKTEDVKLSLVKQPYFPIRVPVTNAPPGTQLSIKVAVQGRDGPGFELGYNSEEQVIEGTLPNGSYRLEAASYGPNVVSGAANIMVRGPLQGPILPVVTTSAINVQVKEEFTSRENPGTGSATGVVGRINRQRPGRDVMVMLEPADDFGLQRGASSRPPSGSSDGPLLVEQVVPGRYWVRVQAGRGYASSVTSGGMDLQHHPLVVPTGGSAPAIEVTLRDDVAVIEGTIEGANSLSRPSTLVSPAPEGQAGPAASAAAGHVYCIPLPDSPGRYSEAEVSPEGKFTLSFLPPGDYRLLAFRRRQPDLAYENSEAMRVYDGKGTVVRLNAGQTEHVQLPLITTSE
jgi:hypothetical protein